jgi:DNA-binding GntR family transcriptional regulator
MPAPSTPPSTAQPFEPESARVARVVREEIVDGTRPPGSRLVERDLAGELGVSRIPVRDALRTLIAEGLVTPRPRTWAVVREFTDADVAHLQEVRSATEPLLFALAAERRSDAQLDAVAERDRAAVRVLAGDSQVALADDVAGIRRVALVKDADALRERARCRARRSDAARRCSAKSHPWRGCPPADDEPPRWR